MPTNSHIPLSSNDIPVDATYVTGTGPVAVEGGAAITDASGVTYAPVVVDLSGDGEQTVAIPAGRATNTIIKTGAGRLGRVLVTAAGTNTMLIFDNATTNSGTEIGVVLSSKVAGDIVDIRMPESNGIVVGGNSNNAGVTISFS